MSIEAYLTRRGTKLDTVNPAGSVPEATPADFSAGILNDPNAVRLLGFDAPAAATSGRPLNRAERRRAAREARAAKAQARRAAETPSSETSIAVEFLLAPIALSPDDTLRISDEMIELAEEADSTVGYNLRASKDELNEFFATHVIPEPEPFVPNPRVPERYTKIRQLYMRLLPGVEAYLAENPPSPWSDDTALRLLVQMRTAGTQGSRAGPRHRSPYRSFRRY